MHTIGVATTGRLLDSIIPRSRKYLVYLEYVVFRSVDLGTTEAGIRGNVLTEQQ